VAKSQNPFPKQFFLIGKSVNWRGREIIKEYEARSDNGWYRLYPVGSNHPWDYDATYRWRDIQRKIEQGSLTLGRVIQEDDGNIQTCEDLI